MRKCRRGSNWGWVEIFLLTVEQPGWGHFGQRQIQVSHVCCKISAHGNVKCSHQRPSSPQSGLLINSPELPIDLRAVFFWTKNTLFSDENFIQEYLQSYSVTKQLERCTQKENNRTHKKGSSFNNGACKGMHT